MSWNNDDQRRRDDEQRQQEQRRRDREQADQRLRDEQRRYQQELFDQRARDDAKRLDDQRRFEEQRHWQQKQDDLKRHDAKKRQTEENVTAMLADRRERQLEDDAQRANEAQEHKDRLNAGYQNQQDINARESKARDDRYREARRAQDSQDRWAQQQSAETGVAKPLVQEYTQGPNPASGSTSWTSAPNASAASTDTPRLDPPNATFNAANSGDFWFFVAMLLCFAFVWLAQWPNFQALQGFSRFCASWPELPVPLQWVARFYATVVFEMGRPLVHAINAWEKWQIGAAILTWLVLSVLPGAALGKWRRVLIRLTVSALILPAVIGLVWSGSASSSARIAAPTLTSQQMASQVALRQQLEHWLQCDGAPYSVDSALDNLQAQGLLINDASAQTPQSQRWSVHKLQLWNHSVAAITHDKGHPGSSVVCPEPCRRPMKSTIFALEIAML